MSQTIIDQFKALPAADQIDVAQMIDRLTWSKRWAEICQRISGDPKDVSDEEIDRLVRDVRREKPLSERSSTHLY